MKRAVTLFICAALAVVCLAGCAQRAYELDECITLGQYTGLSVEYAPAVTDEDVQERIEQELFLSSEQERVYDRPVRDGDTVGFAFYGEYEGGSFREGDADHYYTDIGSGTYLFEEALIGASIGDTVEYPATLPEDYSEEQPELNGKEVVFKIKIENIVGNTPPELDAEFAKSMGYDSVEEYRAGVREELIAEAGTEEARKKAAILAAVTENSEIKEYPVSEVQSYVTQMYAYYRAYAQELGMTDEEFVTEYFEMTTEEFEDLVYLQAHNEVEAILVTEAIAEAEGIKMSYSDYTAAQNDYAVDAGYKDAADFKAQTGHSLADYYGEAAIRRMYIYNAATDFLLQNNAFTEAKPE